MGNRSRHICGTSHDNRRQTERNEACFNCWGAKEEKQSLKEPSAEEAVQPNGRWRAYPAVDYQIIWVKYKGRANL